MRIEVRENLEAIIEHGSQIEEFVSELTFETYANDPKTRLAVERAFEIIGEALNRIAKMEPEVLEHITDHRKIISFRNILAHCYDSVEDKIVWGIVEDALPQLMDQVRCLLPEGPA